MGPQKGRPLSSKRPDEADVGSWPVSTRPRGAAAKMRPVRPAWPRCWTKNLRGAALGDDVSTTARLVLLASLWIMDAMIPGRALDTDGLRIGLRNLR